MVYFTILRISIICDILRIIDIEYIKHYYTCIQSRLQSDEEREGYEKVSANMDSLVALVCRNASRCRACVGGYARSEILRHSGKVGG